MTSRQVRRRQTVERKAGFIHQTLTGTNDRTIDDIASDQELSYAEVKALATGDPRILHKAALESDVARLRRQKHAHHEDQARLQRTHQRALETVVRLAAAIDVHTALAAQVVDTRGDIFAAEIDGTRYTVRADAGAAIHGRMEYALETARSGDPTRARLVELGGITFHLHAGPHADAVSIGIERTAIALVIDAAQLPALDHSQLVQRLEHTTRTLPHELGDVQRQLARTRSEITAATARLGEPFPDETTLTARQAELTAINTELEGPAAPTHHETHPRATPCPGPTPA